MSFAELGGMVVSSYKSASEQSGYLARASRMAWAVRVMLGGTVSRPSKRHDVNFSYILNNSATISPSVISARKPYAFITARSFASCARRSSAGIVVSS